MTGALSWDIGLATLSEYDADGFLGIQVDGYGEDKAGLASYEAHGLIGTLGRPMDPDVDPSGQPLEGKSCAVLYANEGSKAHAFCLNDPRSLSKLPALQKGESVLFAPNNICQFIRFHSAGGASAPGTISICTTDDGTVDGKTITSYVSPDQLDGFVQFAPWGSTKFNATGFHVTHVSGAELHGFGMTAAGIPSALSSFWHMSGDAIELEASVVNLGPNPETQDAIVLFKGLMAIITLQQAAFDAVSAALLSFIPGPTATMLGAPAAIAAISALDAGLAANVLLMTSSTTTSN